ncbi:putative dihydrouridine synthase (Dus) [Trypanosoma rangeli]|uniref:Putative dihydrouridine synthase (Dus) n=1 Tax=Trypanosoma rangeli TaxID=5698 RepID=A0A3R7KRE2_TRYRA|nr:putative dihydrouridine synthase (Dus) [Trypanosoma rangeli]RNE99837.1 putative dihydrouridine synthase (Dus) [Trypanosoma rangeli]|eukprot:RNE99837.1 putative dihydrouridine synthase (Dus) [Trypanosoma rangeli]
MRVFDDDGLTLKYAEMLRDTGIAVLCVHGRTRHNKRELADVAQIRRVREHLCGSIPVIGNGNVLVFEDVLRNLSVTGCEGYMCAEPLLWDPRLFSAPPHPMRNGRYVTECREARLGAIRTAQEYLQLVQRYPVDVSFVKAHLFKMLFPCYETYPALHGWLTTFTCNSRSSCKSREKTESPRRQATAKASSDFFTTAMAALGEHLRHMYATEVSCNIDGPPPKRAKERHQNTTDDTSTPRERERRKAAVMPSDPFAEDEVLGIAFD